MCATRLQSLVAIASTSFVLFVSPHLAAQDVATTQRASDVRFNGDPLALKSLTPTYDLYMDSSLLDNSDLLDAPAGKHGFVEARDGHFVFSDGNRARFWGVTITQEHNDIPHYRIEQVADTLARAGVNIVRFHSLDNRGGEQYGLVRRSVIDDAYPNNRDSQHFDPDYLDRMDYWIAQLKKRGIYSFIVLRGYRTFREGDGVANADQLDRAARPYSFFDPRLIELQKQYARQLLAEHVNSYTGLSWANDPSVALIELFNEDSLFSRPERWQNMPEPYATNFRNLFNDWLTKKYSTTAALKQVWTNADGLCALQPDESLEKKNIQLPMMNLLSFEQAMSSPYDDPRRSPARRRDATLFACDLQRQYFRDMKTFLRGVGVKGPICGVVAGHIVADTQSAAEELDFTAENAYFEHPMMEPGRPWLPPFYYANKNYLKEDTNESLMPWTTRYKWAGVPISVREWATCWPNQFRAACILEAAAYARLQDYDAMCYFAYYTTGDFTRLSAFAVNNDPVRWGLFAYGARLFLTGAVAPAKCGVDIAFNSEDLAAYSSFTDDLNKIAWTHRVENRLVGDTFDNRADLTISSGRSHAGQFIGDHAFLFSRSEFVDATQREKATGEKTLQGRSGYVAPTKDIRDAIFVYQPPAGGPKREIHIEKGKGFDAQAMEEKGAASQAQGSDLKVTPMVYDPIREIVLLADMDTSLIPGFVFDFMNLWYQSPMTSALQAEGKYISDTGELRRDTKSGRLLIDTPTFQVVQGTFDPDEPLSTTDLRVQSVSPFAVVAACSLDDQPLKRSHRFQIKMVTVAENRNQYLVGATHPAMQGTFVMTSEGTTPIVTKGVPSDTPTSISLRGRPLIRAYLTNGNWEAVFDLDRKEIFLWCDTINTRFA
ncbi:MAG: hypothetical protein V2A74_08475, partial [bacterium]